MKKERVQSIGFAVLVSFCFLAVCSRSSFIYPFNNWDDANSYFSMGKVMMNGGVIYRDIFDQKGPLLYFIYGIGYLISNTTFLGVFILEIIALAAVLSAEYKILKLYLGHRLSMMLIPACAFVITVSKSFYWGGCAEEFCLPFLAWGLYFSVKYFKEEYPKNISYKMVIMFGFLAGCVMLVKYTLLGFYFAWMGMIALANFNSRNWRGSIRNCCFFLLGMMMPLIPWLVYFGVNGALDDWYHAYIYCNVFFYSDVYTASLFSFEKIYILAKIMYWLILDNFIYLGPIIFGFFCILFSKRFRWFEKFNIYIMFGCLFLGIYIGGTTLYYYSLPLSIFSVFGFLIVGMGIKWLMGRFFVGRRVQKYFVMTVVSICIVLLAGAWNLSMNTGFAKQKKEDFYLYKFRNIILQEENPTLLNISCLDAGLYTWADIMPNCKYFQSNAVRGFDEVREEQLRYIEEKKIDFILARDYYPEEITQNYKLIMEENYAYGEQDFVYYLFKKK